MQHLEMKLEKTTFKRVDADIVQKLIEKEEAEKHTLTEEQSTQLKTLFENAFNNTNMKVEIESLPAEALPVTITMEEWMRRMKEMSKMGGGPMSFYGSMPDTYKVAVNANHKLISKILGANEATQATLAKQACDLALLSQGLLKGADLTKFVERSVEVL
jgi:molecular chaperone HtpG